MQADIIETDYSTKKKSTTLYNTLHRDVFVKYFDYNMLRTWMNPVMHRELYNPSQLLVSLCDSIIDAHFKPEYKENAKYSVSVMDGVIKSPFLNIDNHYLVDYLRYLTVRYQTICIEKEVKDIYKYANKFDFLSIESNLDEFIIKLFLNKNNTKSSYNISKCTYGFSNNYSDKEFTGFKLMSMDDCSLTIFNLLTHAFFFNADWAFYIINPQSNILLHEKFTITTETVKGSGDEQRNIIDIIINDGIDFILKAGNAVYPGIEWKDAFNLPTTYEYNIHTIRLIYVLWLVKIYEHKNYIKIEKSIELLDREKLVF